MPNDLVTLVAAIEAWETAKSWVQVPALTTYLQRVLNAPLSEDEVERALERLERRGHLQRRGNQIRVDEPDRAERHLYSHIHRGPNNAQLLGDLGIYGSAFVLQDTPRWAAQRLGCSKDRTLCLLSASVGASGRASTFSALRLRIEGEQKSMPCTMSALTADSHTTPILFAHVRDYFQKTLRKSAKPAKAKKSGLSSSTSS
jgi:hypothetical protein